MAYGFVDEMRSMQFQGSCQSSYHYVAACTVKWMNDRILEFCKDAGLDGKSGWQLFKEKEYLGNFENKQELGKILEQFILRFEQEPNLSKVNTVKNVSGNCGGYQTAYVLFLRINW